MHRKLICCLLFILPCISSSYAEVYKCTDKNGIVKFSDRPCGKNSKVLFSTERGIKDIEDSLINFSVEVPVGDLSKMNGIRAYEIKKHALYMGSLIFPDLRLISDKTMAPLDGAVLNYGSFATSDVYTMEINYDFDLENTLKVRNILFQKNSVRSDIKKMAGAKRLCRIGVGCWWVHD
jgi:hypothetical protein